MHSVAFTVVTVSLQDIIRFSYFGHACKCLFDVKRTSKAQGCPDMESTKFG